VFSRLINVFEVEQKEGREKERVLEEEKSPNGRVSSV
jgi:hypothetical protein